MRFAPDDLNSSPEPHLMLKYIFHIQGVSLKLYIIEVVVHTESWYCSGGVSITTISLSFSEWFRLYDFGLFIIWIYVLYDLWRCWGCTPSECIGFWDVYCSHAGCQWLRLLHGCLYPLQFILNYRFRCFGLCNFGFAIPHPWDGPARRPSFVILDWTCYHWNPLYQNCISN